MNCGNKSDEHDENDAITTNDMVLVRFAMLHAPESVSAGASASGSASLRLVCIGEHLRLYFTEKN